jgi:NitT/TauT family transport system ATP-binding protein
VEGAEKMIVFKDVCFSYGEKQIFENFNLTIEKGDRICLFGKSGRGKTTLLRLIMGLEKPQKGELTVDGSISAVFQEDRLLPFKSVGENISFITGNENTDEVLKKLNLIEEKNSFPLSLSGGMSRRVAIARSLCKDGDIYIFDEPFTGLDKGNIVAASKAINEMTKGKTVIAVLHEKDYAGLLDCRVIEL